MTTIVRRNAMKDWLDEQIKKQREKNFKKYVKEIKSMGISEISKAIKIEKERVKLCNKN